LGVDPELRRTATGVARGRAAGIRSPDPGVDADPHGRSGRAAPEALELAQQIDVHVHARVEDRRELAFGDVGPGVADLIGRPAVAERPLDLARRADVEAHPGASIAEEPQ